MKLILQIAIGVFLGSFMSQAGMDFWRDHKAQESARVEREQKDRQEQAAMAARKLIMEQFTKKQEEDVQRNGVTGSPTISPERLLGLPPGMPVPKERSSGKK